MNSLMNYGSDDDCDGSGDDRTSDSGSTSGKNAKKPDAATADVNYEEVQMDLSEESSDSKNGESNNKREEPRKDYSSSRNRDDRRREKRRYREEDNRVKDRNREDRDRGSYRDRSRNDDTRGERQRDKYRGRDSGRDDKYRDRKDRRERKRSRSPAKRERSKSRESSVSGKSNNYTNRYDRANTKMNRLDKMGIEIKTPDCQFVKPSDLQKSMSEEKNSDASKDRFFMPGITGRFRDQIERRKLLWQKKDPEAVEEVKPLPQIAPGSSRTTKVWEATTFAQDSDGKVANKFKRLMGIRNPGEDGPSGGTEVLKKQEEMFSSMEQQYEVARTATHTMRGVGLGFSSYPR